MAETKGAPAPIVASLAIENELCLFPLFTKKALTQRWGVSYAVLCNWESRHIDFPAKITGIIVGEAVGGMYPAREVFQYETERNLKIHEHAREELEPWGWNDYEQL